jgi:hypothetical protein
MRLLIFYRKHILFKASNPAIRKIAIIPKNLASTGSLSAGERWRGRRSVEALTFKAFGKAWRA